MTMASFRFDAEWTERARRIKGALVCPTCRGELDWSAAGASCDFCTARYPYRDGKFHFIGSASSHDPLDRLKERMKRRLGKLFYRVGRDIVAPTFPFSQQRAVRRWANPSSALIVDIGSGNHRWDDDVISVDSMNYPEVDIVADITALPFRQGSIDGFTSRSLLEHVWPLEKAIAELRRCTRDEGFNLHLIPFLFPFHASPDDFQRLTYAGAGRLFEGWDVVEQYNATGPVTLFLINFIEFLSVLLSFGIPRIKAVLYLGFCLLLFPIKFLDAPFVHRKSWLGLAPTIVTVMRKPRGTADR